MNYKSISLVVLATLAMVSCKKETQNEQGEVTNTIQAAAPIPTENAPKIDPNGKYAKMEFSKVEHDFGTIGPDDMVTTVFSFTNTGEANLLITNATGSCGCTVPEYPKELIEPGQKGDIKVSFNPKGKDGMQSKTVTLTTNTATVVETLTIKANIVK